VGYTERVIVVGAGISGLACAFRLKQLGVHCPLREASHRSGGMIATVRKGGFLYETGPQFPRFPTAAWRLMRDLNLESEFLRGDSKAKRYIVRHGTLHRAPFSPQGLLSSSLVGTRSKWRILTEVFRSSQPSNEEETLAAFVQRKFGPEILDSLVDPIVSTVLMGDPHKMGMQSAFSALVDWESNHGSLVRGAIRARWQLQKTPASCRLNPALEREFWQPARH
jgi:protoporphyrinogen/coproporphyrinogen III oxidase